jgi:predicted  nucleic acid-binding Zn-ribbon protein
MNLKEVIQHVEQAHPNTTPKVVTPDLAQTRLEFSEAFRACCRNKDPLDVLAWTLTRLLETYKDTIQQKTAENHELRVSKLEDTKKIDYLTAEIDRLKQERQKLIDELEKRDKSQGNLTERIQRALGEPGN